MQISEGIFSLGKSEGVHNNFVNLSVYYLVIGILQQVQYKRLCAQHCFKANTFYGYKFWMSCVYICDFIFIYIILIVFI